MSSICPTVTSESTEGFIRQLKLVESFAKRIHIDIMDGNFAPTKSPSLSKIKTSSQVATDIHIMFKDPAVLIEEIIKMQPNLVIVHAESVADIPLYATKMRETGIKTGLAILPETSVESVERLLPHVQHVLIFGGHLGFHGGTADLTQLEKASQIKKLARHAEIGWDGGANNSNVGKIKQAGIDVINVGSAIHKSDDPQAAYNQLVSLVE